MSDSYVSNSYNAETDGKMSQDTATYTNKDGNTVYAVANYKELETEALKIQDDLINPKFICIFRDPFAVARRNIFRLSKDPCKTIKDATKLTLKNIEYIQNSKKPSLICSYENILSDQLEFIKLINNFIGNPISNEEDLKELCKAINPSDGYETKS